MRTGPVAVAMPYASKWARTSSDACLRRIDSCRTRSMSPLCAPYASRLNERSSSVTEASSSREISSTMSCMLTFLCICRKMLWRMSVELP